MTRIGMIFALCCAMVSFADGADISGYNLAPGETLLSVDGNPVAAAPTTVCANGQCQLQPAPVTRREVRQAVRQYRHEVKRDMRAYNWALREAQLCAENNYSNGHPRGVPSGYSSVGTGYSRSPDNPQHCLSEYSPSTYKARACYHCPRTGRYYWAVVR